MKVQKVVFYYVNKYWGSYQSMSKLKRLGIYTLILTRFLATIHYMDHYLIYVDERVHLSSEFTKINADNFHIQKYYMIMY